MNYPVPDFGLDHEIISSMGHMNALEKEMLGKDEGLDSSQKAIAKNAKKAEAPAKEEKKAEAPAAPATPAAEGKKVEAPAKEEKSPAGDKTEL